MTAPGWVRDLEERARAALPEEVFRYYRQGSGQGLSAGEAVAAWDRVRLLPHVLRDVSTVSTVTTLLGTEVSAPVAVAPTTMQRAADPDGEVAMARAVAAADSLMVLSSNAGSSFDDVGATGAAWWLQMYVTAERTTSAPLLARAVDGGARAVVLTVDTPVVASKDDGGATTVWDTADPSWWQRNFDPGHGDRPGDEKAADLGPHDVEWLAATTGLPVVVKGVLRPGDARRCLDAGAAAIWVSNHGGRQLDHVAATADCLSAVVDEVGEEAEVYVDGGVRSGLHLLTARALGARAAFLGRLPLFALAAGGTTEVSELLRRLREELAEAMRLAGCPGLDDLDPRLLAPVRPALRRRGE